MGAVLKILFADHLVPIGFVSYSIAMNQTYNDVLVFNSNFYETDDNCLKYYDENLYELKQFGGDFYDRLVKKYDDGMAYLVYNQDYCDEFGVVSNMIDLNELSDTIAKNCYFCYKE